jgi:acyl-CoA synthetase (AMP-forming)/AMP-acid ligase II
MGEVDDHSHLAYLDGGPSQPIADVKTLFEETATKYPDIEAIVSLHQGPVSLPRFHPVDGEKRLALTYKELKHASDVLAHRLKSFGLCPGTSVAFFSENCAEWVLFCWACVSLGCPLVTMNPAVLGSVNELRHMLQVTGPGVIVVQDAEMGKKLKTNAPEEMEEVFLRISLSKSGAITVPDTLNQEHRESSDEGTPHERLQMREGGPEFRFSRSLGWIHLPDIHAIRPATVTYPPIPTKKSFPDIIAIGFTSGTTSLPKACPQSITNIQTTCGIARARGVGPGHRNLQQAPAYHGLASLPCFAYWSTGGTIVFPSARFDVMASLAAAEKEKCTLMAAVPAVVKALTMVPNVAKKLESVKSIVLAGAPVFPEIIQLCRDVLNIENVSVSWGMTENTSPLYAHVGKDMDLKKDEFFPVGTPTPGMKVKVCAPGSRVPLKRGEEGELHACGPQVIRGYLDVENHTFYEDEDGWWIMTGDAASVGEDGQVRILGRYKDIIIRGGVNIAPAKIEQCLNNVRGIDVSQCPFYSEHSSLTLINLVPSCRYARRDGWRSSRSNHQIPRASS